MSLLNEHNEKMESLLLACQQGDKAALASLYELVAPALNTFAFKILRDEALSNEVLQDSIIAMWEKANTFDPNKGKAVSWVYTIVRHRAIDKLRAESKHSYAVDTQPELLQNQAANEKYQPETQVIFDDSLSLVYKHMATLPENQRTSLQLAYLQDQSRQELADAMETNINTVKSWIKRGLENVNRQTTVSAAQL